MSKKRKSRAIFSRAPRAFRVCARSAARPDGEPAAASAPAVTSQRSIERAGARAPVSSRDSWTWCRCSSFCGGAHALAHASLTPFPCLSP